MMSMKTYAALTGMVMTAPAGALNLVNFYQHAA
jgi:hypothetical protein